MFQGRSEGFGKDDGLEVINKQKKYKKIMSENKKKLLLIVDAQYDFISGSLPVKNAILCMGRLGDYIEETCESNPYNTIVATADWHPISHCSFKENGGEWPMHCVAYSNGAAISHFVLKGVMKCKCSDFHVLTKGTAEDHEEYSVFRNAASCVKLHKIVESQEIEEIDICGIAGDYCVLESLKDALREFPSMQFKVLEKFTASIDGGKTLAEFVNSTSRVEFA